MLLPRALARLRVAHEQRAHHPVRPPEPILQRIFPAGAVRLTRGVVLLDELVLLLEHAPHLAQESVRDVRGQRIILAQKLKLPDGTTCKTDCLLAQRIVNKDMLEIGEWNSNTAVFKSMSPREYVYRCEK